MLCCGGREGEGKHLRDICEVLGCRGKAAAESLGQRLWVCGREEGGSGKDEGEEEGGKLLGEHFEICSMKG